MQRTKCLYRHQPFTDLENSIYHMQPDMGTKPKLCLDHGAEGEAKALPFLNHKAEAESEAQVFGSYYKGPCFTLFTEIQANCSGQNGLKVKTVDIFSFWDHKGKVEDLTFLDHEAEAFVKSRS